MKQYEVIQGVINGTPAGGIVKLSEDQATAFGKEYVKLHSEESSDEGSDEKTLADHTVNELKALAEEQGIDLGNATKKADIVAVIEVAQKSVEAPENKQITQSPETK